VGLEKTWDDQVTTPHSGPISTVEGKPEAVEGGGLLTDHRIEHQEDHRIDDLVDGSTDDQAGVDGRTLRRHRNRAAAVDALLDLYHDGNYRPSSVEIADRAGLSSRSLFRYFEDVDDLIRAAVERQVERAWPLLPIDARPGDPLGARIEELAIQRVRVYEAITPASTISRLHAPFQPALAAQLRRSRAFFRSQVEELFAPELGAMEPTRAEIMVSALDVLTSFDTYALIRQDQDLSEAHYQAVLIESLTLLLASRSGE
jgi:AcrR family transcriptional regulator